MIFLTVGTQFGFDRLVKAADTAIGQGLINQPVFAQIGDGQYKPRHMEYVSMLNKQDFDRQVEQCSAMISHAGIGSITQALEKGKPLLVMPRRKKFKEVVNDHQVDTAEVFERLGHILAAHDEQDFFAKLPLLETFVPKPRYPNRQGVIDRIERFLKEIGL